MRKPKGRELTVGNRVWAGLRGQGYTVMEEPWLSQKFSEVGHAYKCFAR